MACQVKYSEIQQMQILSQFGISREREREREREGERMVYRATEWSVGGFDKLTTRARIYLDIDRRTDEPYQLSIELPAMAKCRRSVFENSALTMAQKRLSYTINIQSYEPIIR